MSEWQEQANCRGLNPDIFFPERGDVATYKLAKSVCAECVVQEQCLEENIYEKEGIWGNTSGKERRLMRRELYLTTIDIN